MLQVQTESESAMVPTSRNSSDPKARASTASFRGPGNFPKQKNADGSSLPSFRSQSSSVQQADGFLSSWKDISAYLGRGVRTVQRWEVSEGLPVHRIGIGNRAPVFAFANEIDLWLHKKYGEPRRPFQAWTDPAANGGISFRKKWLIRFIRELRANTMQLEQQVAGDGTKPTPQVTNSLRKLKGLVDSALVRDHMPGKDHYRKDGELTPPRESLELMLDSAVRGRDR